MANHNEDYYYAQLIKIMRKNGSKDNPKPPQLATVIYRDKKNVENPIQIKVGTDLLLNAEDLYLPSGSDFEEGDMVLVNRVLNTNKYIIYFKVVDAL